VARRIEECESTGRWQFLYLGADLHDARALGIENSIQFDPDKQGMAHATGTLSVATRAFMKGRNIGINKNKGWLFN
jgi:hypothetical protein